MLRRFCCRSRSCLAMLLTFCLVSVSLWSYGADALADVLSDETAVTATGAAGDHGAAGKACNHGCHAQTHLTGVDCGQVSLPAPRVVETLCPTILVVMPSHPRDG